MATTWDEEGALVDMKNRLDKLRIRQSRQKLQDDDLERKDTLKILQSKFGSMVYDPTNPLQKAYDRRCARTGRRKSIEFEDLYLTNGAGRLNSHFSPPSAGATPRKPPLTRSNTGVDHLLRSSPSSPAASRRSSADHTKQGRRRKTSPSSSSDSPSTSSASSSVFRKIDPFHQNGSSSGSAAVGSGSGKGQGGHPKSQGQGHGVRAGLMSVTVSEEERKLIDQRLSGIETGTGSGIQPPSPSSSSQRRRKISCPSKLASKRQ